MEDLPKLLTEFESILGERKRPLLDKFNPGISQDKIGELLQWEQTANSDLLTLYNWRNGIDTNEEFLIGEYDFSSFGFMLSLEKAIEIRSLYVKKELVKEFLLPVFADGTGNFIFFDCNVESPSHGRLLLYAPGLILSNVPMPVFDSIGSYFKTINECYKRNAYSYSENGALEIDDELEGEISRKFNPGSTYWEE